MSNARHLVLQLLQRWDQGGAHAQDLLSAELQQSKKLSPEDRTLVRHLFFGVLRHRRLLDHWITHLRGPGKAPVDRGTARLLHLGLFQLFHTRIPDHAAVNETLRLASPRNRGLLNAMLRRAGRERETLAEVAAKAPDAIRYSLPDFLFEKWRTQFGEEAAKELGCWCQEPAPVYLRRNDLLPQAKALLTDHGLSPVADLAREDFYLVETLPPTILDAGAGYVQDPATVLACDLLDVKPGQKVLDAFAAPGGKTAYLAQLMANEGTLVATDSLNPRLERLRENLSRLGATCARSTRCDWKAPHPDLGLFDRILLDVPCSNTGVLRRRLDLRWRLKPEVFSEMADLQFQLARNVLRQLKPGGQAVYSTCSIEPEENEQVVERLLEDNPALERRLVKRSLPHRDGFDGAYIALLVRHADGDSSSK